MTQQRLYQLEIITIGSNCHAQLPKDLRIHNEIISVKPIKASDQHKEKMPVITKVRLAKSADAAIAWAKRFGSVISCHKVDTTPYINNIEYLCKDVIGKPVEIQVDTTEFRIDVEGLSVSVEESVIKNNIVLDKSK